MQDAEKSVIGCILMDKTLIGKARLRLSGKMFSSETLGLVFSGMLKLHKRGTPVDIVTVLGVLGDSYKTLLTECAETVPSLSAFESYVDC
ncbi:MAG: DnaB-like helicase N-terminal domain-containing protein, partial [Oscillospiraceae bacterium]